METPQLNDLLRLQHALRAMTKSLNRAQMTGMYSGAGDTAAQTYQRLHEKIVALMPDDFFVQTLTLELPKDATDEQKIAQTGFIVSQLSDYVDSIIRDEGPGGSDVEDLRHMGLELRDQILRMTKNTVRSAISNIDWVVSSEDEDEDWDEDTWREERRSRRTTASDSQDSSDGETENGDTDQNRERRKVRVQVQLDSQDVNTVKSTDDGAASEQI